MKKLVVLNIIFLLCLLFIFNSSSFASGMNIEQYFKSDSYDKLDFKTMGSNIYSALKIVGIIIAVCMITYMSICYMIATPQKRAQLKERLFLFIVGVVFLVAGVAFLDWYEGAAKDVADNFANGTSTSSIITTNPNGNMQTITSYR